ncbi:hypothetical protein cyc_08284 [Cyclospora cayetanensis]|uniref:Transmembrane protein n=1 Tax=Cyclospora cayetanensis TaxID=88456 RepID=A0A1D3CVG6_9EIME|nr:hypothetical protein cyc_08284 [Cyclospora cayetanensis]
MAASGATNTLRFLEAVVAAWDLLAPLLLGAGDLAFSVLGVILLLLGATVTNTLRFFCPSARCCTGRAFRSSSCLTCLGVLGSAFLGVFLLLDFVGLGKDVSTATLIGAAAADLSGFVFVRLGAAAVAGLAAGAVLREGFPPVGVAVFSCVPVLEALLPMARAPPVLALLSTCEVLGDRAPLLLAAEFLGVARLGVPCLVSDPGEAPADPEPRLELKKDPILFIQMRNWMQYEQGLHRFLLGAAAEPRLEQAELVREEQKHCSSSNVGGKYNACWPLPYGKY